MVLMNTVRNWIYQGQKMMGHMSIKAVPQPRRRVSIEVIQRCHGK